MYEVPVWWVWPPSWALGVGLVLVLVAGGVAVRRHCCGTLLCFAYTPPLTPLPPPPTMRWGGGGGRLCAICACADTYTQMQHWNGCQVAQGGGGRSRLLPLVRKTLGSGTQQCTIPHHMLMHRNAHEFAYPAGSSRRCTDHCCHTSLSGCHCTLNRMYNCTFLRKRWWCRYTMSQLQGLLHRTKLRQKGRNALSH